jgi:hypothetical protein
MAKTYSGVNTCISLNVYIGVHCLKYGLISDSIREIDLGKNASLDFITGTFP